MATVENDNRENQWPDSQYQRTASTDGHREDSEDIEASDTPQEQGEVSEESQPAGGPASANDGVAEWPQVSTEPPQTTPPWEPENESEASQPSVPPRRRRSIIVPVLLSVLCLLVIAVVAAGWKVMRDREQMSSALTATLKTMETASMGTDSRNLVTEAMQELQNGNYSRVKDIMSSFASAANRSTQPQLLPPGAGSLDPAGALGGSSAGDALPPEAYKDLPKGAADYFRTHEDILRAFLRQCDVSRTLRDKGVAVDDLRGVRDAIIEAANLGQHEKVQALLGDMTKMTMQKGGPVPEMPEELVAGVKKFREVAQDAQKQRRDIRPAIELMQRADKLAIEGKTDEAAALVQKAISSARSAKRMQLRGPAMARAGGMRPRGQMGSGERRVSPAMARTGMMNRQNERAGLAQVLLQNLLSMISAEEADLSRIYHAIDSAKVAVREKNAEQVKEILGTAFESFDVIGKRRQAFSQAMNKMMSAAAQGEVRTQAGETPQPGNQRPQGNDRPRRDAAGAQGAMRPTANTDRMDRLIKVQAARAMAVLERARNLSDEEFAKRRDAIQRELEIALTQPGQSPQTHDAAKPEENVQKPQARPTEGLDTVPIYKTETDRAKAESRIRSKMVKAQGPFIALKASGKNPELVEKLERLFSAARLSLYAEDYVEAEVLVDEGMRMLGMDVVPLLDEEQVKQILDAVD